MNLIAQNPYRVLGMFANDSLKVMTANISRIRAYNHVGKQISFACDYIDTFGKVDRSEEAIQLAITQLSDKIESKVWQLFWLHSTSENDIDVNTPPIQSDINQAVLAFNNYQHNNEAAQAWSRVFERKVKDLNIFENHYFWENENEKIEVAKKFLDKIIPNSSSDSQSFQYGTSEGWFWWFIDNLSKDSCLLSVLEIKYKGFAFEFIKEIIAGHIGVAAIGNKYRKLLWLAKPYLRILDEFTIYDNERKIFKCPNDIQILKDNLANCLINFSIEVYDNTYYWEESQLSDMIDFIDVEVRELVCSSTTHDFLEKRLKTLKSQLPYLAPEECKEDAKRIHELIEAFCEKEDSVKWSLWLIKQCSSSLITIRQTLGSDNLFYRYISTKIADNAIYSADVALCSAERMSSNPANDKQIAITHLKNTIHLCRILICNIELYDLQENFLDEKFAAYKNLVTRIAKKYNCIDDKVGPTISMFPEAEELALCGDDYIKLCNFVLAHPEGKYYCQAVDKIHNIEDASWPQIVTVENLFEYKRKFPNSHNESKIIAALDLLLFKTPFTGSSQTEISYYHTILKLFPNHPWKSEIHDRIEFLIYQRCADIQDCQEYLDAYPNGKYVQSIKEKVKEIKKDEINQDFRKCRTIADYKRFIQQHPTSELCAQAYLNIENLVWELAKHNGDFEAYIRQYPKGRYVPEAQKLLCDRQKQILEMEDDSLFQSCETINDFRSYIITYPNGKHTQNAKAIIRRHYRKSFLFIILPILLVLALLGYIYLIYPTEIKEKPSIAFCENDDQDIPSSSFSSSIEIDDIDEVKDVSKDVSKDESDNRNISEPNNKNKEEIIKDEQENIDNEWINNSITTGSRPYSSHYGSPLSGKNEFRFKTASGNDYIILIKRKQDNRYVDHKYVQGGDKITILVPDGTYNVFIYSGNGWNPNKTVGACTGGFVSNESFHKDGPITMTTTIQDEYYYNETCEYTLYPVRNGNLHLKSSNPNEAFN